MNIKHQINKFYVWLIVATITGFTAISSQCVFIREFLLIFHGNEIIIGVILCNWMMVTGIGSYLGARLFKKNLNINVVLFLFLFSGILPLISVFCLNYLCPVFFDYGVIVEFSGIFFYSLVILFPFCIISGALFPFIAFFTVKYKKNNSVPLVYAAEAFGGFVGGVLTSIVFVNYFDDFTVLVFLLILSSLMAIILALTESKKYYAAFMIAISAIVLFSWSFGNFSNIARKSLFVNQEIVACKDTPWGNLTAVRQHGQLSYFLSGELLFSSHQVIQNEENVHFALMQIDNPQQVLIISGDSKGLLYETSKYKNCKTTFIEENKWLTNFQIKYSGLSINDDFEIINNDPVKYLSDNNDKFDACIYCGGPPLAIIANRFYTLEFFQRVKSALTNNGVFMTSLESTAEYLSPEASDEHSVLYSTLSVVFKNVIIIPGEKNYFIASDGELSLNIAELADSSEIQNLYVNSGYVDDYLIQQKSENIQNKISTKAKINKDYYPVACYFALKRWLGIAGSGYTIIMLVICLLFLLPLIFNKPEGTGLWVTGFTGASMEVLLLTAYQALCGYMYSMAGMLFGVFMLGLVAGALAVKKLRNISRYTLSVNQLAIGFFCLLTPIVFLLLKDIMLNHFILNVIFVIVIFVLAVLCGLQFSLAGLQLKDNVHKRAGVLYFSDMIGSAAGALICGALLIPLAGITNVAFMIGLLNLIVAAYLFLRIKYQKAANL